MHPDLFILNKEAYVPVLEGFGMGTVATLIGSLFRRVFTRSNRRRLIKALASKDFPRRFAAVEVFLPKRTRKKIWHPAYHEALAVHTGSQPHFSLKLLNTLFALKMVWWMIITARFAASEWMLLLMAKKQSLHREWTRMLALRQRLVHSRRRMQQAGTLKLRLLHRFKQMIGGQTYEVRVDGDGTHSTIELHTDVSLEPEVTHELKFIASVVGNAALGANTVETIIDKG